MRAALCGLALLLTAGSAAARSPKTGWLYGQFTFNAAQLNARMVSFSKVRLRGPLMRDYSGILLSTTGEANRTLTLALKVPAGRHALKNIEAEFVASGGHFDYVERLTISLKGQPVIEVPVDGAVDLGVQLILPGPNKDDPATLVAVAEHSTLPLDRPDTTPWKGIGRDVAANLARRRQAAAVLDWVPTVNPDEEFLTATLGRVYWRRGSGAWTALDLPTVSHVNSVAWHPQTGRYWFGADGGQYWRAATLNEPTWEFEQREAVSLRTQHLGVLPDGRLWTYQQGAPVRNGKSRRLLARVATGNWTQIGLPRNNIQEVDQALETPTGPWLISLDRLRYDVQKKTFVRYPGRPPVLHVRHSQATWARLAEATPGLIEHSLDSGQTWQPWGRTPNPRDRFGSVEIRANGAGLLLKPDSSFRLSGPTYFQIVYRTGDHGASWSEVGRLPADCNQLLPALTEGDPIVVRCATGIRTTTVPDLNLAAWAPRVAAP